MLWFYIGHHCKKSNWRFLGNTQSPLHLLFAKFTALTVYHYSFSYAMKFVETPIYKLIERHCPPQTLDKEGKAICCEGFYRFDGDSYLDDQCFRKFKAFSLIL